MLKLCWKDIQGNEYILGNLYVENNTYYFEINEEDLKKATKNGCFGIGELNLLYNTHTSDTLFDFFKRRIPNKKNVNIKQILDEYGMTEYDEMELLRKTKGELPTDRYYLTE